MNSLVEPTTMFFSRFLTFLILLSCAGCVIAEEIPLHELMDVPLAGHATRLDYASLDPAKHLLFIAHLGDSNIMVFDTEKNKVIQVIPHIEHVHGVLVVPELNRVYASATTTNEVVVIDETSLREIARIPGGIYPDGMAYASREHKLYVSDEHGKTETVINTVNNQRVATIPLGSEVGNSQYDPVSHHVFVNAQTTNELLEIDPLPDRVINRYPLTHECIGAHGLLIDATDRLAFIACEGTHILVEFNLLSRSVMQSYIIVNQPDVLAFDEGQRLLYIAGEQGSVSLFRVGYGVNKIWQGLIGNNAHVVVTDPQTGRVYFPLMNVNGSPVLRIMH
ncbi:MAG: hypothetical protein B7Z60_06235 [Ferrovum sp. 37-45-19]|nr:MAG: hypothetical protein B7Z65_04675 [Ferrovum sp. 21-44-67]OYV94047.1 MAG: hypothetical protein B7Z60_06235 [Ferrovum sp. 37-45-19]HQT82321.1 YncE family protein [Ferrovaceae bacterium]